MFYKGRVKKDVGERNVWVSPPQDLGYYRTGLRYRQFVSFAKYNPLCNLNVYLKYSKAKETFEIHKVKIDWDVAFTNANG